MNICVSNKHTEESVNFPITIFLVIFSYSHLIMMPCRCQKFMSSTRLKRLICMKTKEQPCDPPVKYIKVHMAIRWIIRHVLLLLWFKDLMNATYEVTIHRSNLSTLLSSAFIRWGGAWAESICQSSKQRRSPITGDSFRLIPPNCMVSQACVLR